MTKRKNYDVALRVTQVGSSNTHDAITNGAKTATTMSAPPPLRRKKPKTMKIEAEVEEIVIVNGDDLVDNGKIDTGDVLVTTEKDEVGPMIKIQKKKKKLRRVNFDAEEEDILLGTSIHDTTAGSSMNYIKNGKNSTVLTAPSSGSATASTTSNATTSKLGSNAKSAKVFEDVRPTTIRMTERGGYLHTKQSRMKMTIGRSNVIGNNAFTNSTFHSCIVVRCSDQTRTGAYVAGWVPYI